MKNCDISLLFLLTQIVGTQLGAVLTSIHYQCFLSSKTKGSECPCKLHFSLYKVGFSSVPIAHTCLHDDTDFELHI